MEKKTNKRKEIAEAIIEEYEPETVGEMQTALKDIFGPMFEAMLQGEMNAHLGYESNARTPKDTVNRRNGYSLIYFYIEKSKNIFILFDLKIKFTIKNIFRLTFDVETSIM